MAVHERPTQARVIVLPHCSSEAAELQLTFLPGWHKYSSQAGSKLASGRRASGPLGTGLHCMCSLHAHGSADTGHQALPCALCPHAILTDYTQLTCAAHSSCIQAYEVIRAACTCACGANRGNGLVKCMSWEVRVVWSRGQRVSCRCVMLGLVCMSGPLVP
jgi:hypothetical protein